MNFLVFSALFFPIVIAGFSIFLFSTSSRNLKLITAFSGAFLLSISFVDILPEIYNSKQANLIGLFILLGFFIQLILDFLTKGVEHGHLHHQHEAHEKHHVSPIPVMIGICIHSFLEGMPLAENFHLQSLTNTLLTGIVIHNIPISMVLMSLLLHYGYSRRKSITFLLIFSLSSPLAVISSYYVGGALLVNTEMFFNLVMAMVVGIFLH
ncbi:MAG: ZIP family metal transporter, partial [Bacteroidota bacterium]